MWLGLFLCDEVLAAHARAVFLSFKEVTHRAGSRIALFYHFVFIQNTLSAINQAMSGVIFYNNNLALFILT